MAEKEGSASKSGARTAFTEGDFVVYPNHGAGCIAGIEEKTILGEVRRYYVVYLPDTELTVSIPADGDDTGLRACASEEDLDDVEGVGQARARAIRRNLKRQRSLESTGEVM